MTPTPEMIEAGARAICIARNCDPDELLWITIEPGVQEPYGPRWRAYSDDANEAIKAALAAMWLPFPQKSPPRHCDVMVKTRDGIVMNDELTDDGWMITDDDDVVAFAPLPIFEDRK